MKPELHTELHALCTLFYSGEISEEEWALLQIHMAYCERCYETFRQLSLASGSDNTDIPPLEISSGSREG